MPGRPDLIFPKYRAVIFVHGCYWHGHPGCKDATMPKSNVSFWTQKFTNNTERDRRVVRELIGEGWRVMVVWECELKKQTVETIQRVKAWLIDGRIATDQIRDVEQTIDRGVLLSIAEDKVHYRINSYNEK